MLKCAKILIVFICSCTAVLLCPCFPTPSFPATPPHSLTHRFANRGSGWLSICNSYIIKPFLFPAAKSCSPESATGRNLQQATTILSLHSPTSRLPFHRLPAASPHPCLPHLFPFSALSLYFFFMLSNCLLRKLMQHPLPYRRTHPGKRNARRQKAHTDACSAQTDKDKTRGRGDESFISFFDSHKP